MVTFLVENPPPGGKFDVNEPSWVAVGFTDATFELRFFYFPRSLGVCASVRAAIAIR